MNQGNNNEFPPQDSPENTGELSSQDQERLAQMEANLGEDVEVPIEERISLANDKIQEYKTQLVTSHDAEASHRDALKANDGKDMFPKLKEDAKQARIESSRLKSEIVDEIPVLAHSQGRIEQLQSAYDTADDSDKPNLQKLLESAKVEHENAVRRVMDEGPQASDFESREETLSLEENIIGEQTEPITTLADERVIDISASESETVTPSSKPEKGDKKEEKKKGDGAGKDRSLEGSAMRLMQSPTPGEKAVREGAVNFVEKVDRKYGDLSYAGPDEIITPGGRRTQGDIIGAEEYQPNLQASIDSQIDIYRSSSNKENREELAKLIVLRDALIEGDASLQEKYDDLPKATKDAISKSDSQVRLMGTLNQYIHSKRSLEYKKRERKEVLAQDGKQKFKDVWELVKSEAKARQDRRTFNRSVTLNNIEHAKSFPGGSMGKAFASGGIKLYESITSAIGAIPLVAGLGLAYLTNELLTRFNNLGNKWKKEGWAGLKKGIGL